MSVSLRDKVAKLFQEYNIIIQGKGAVNFLNDVCSLFPPQLTEEEIVDIIHSNFSCGYDRNGCPDEDDMKRIAQALIGKCGGNPNEGLPEYAQKAVDLENKLCGILSAYCGETGKSEGAVDTLLRLEDELMKYRRATPTFSGEVIDKTKSVGCNTCEYEERICITPCTYKKKPTEQKELDLTLEEKVKVLMTIHDDIENLHQIKHKPIPAEKKEYIGGTISLNDLPKPKDRIECCGICGGSLVEIRGRYPNEPQRKVCPTCCAERLDQIKEISDRNYGVAYTEKPIRHINKES